jgi:ribonuclease HI
MNRPPRKFDSPFPEHLKGKFITIFADASYCPDTGAAGYGGWVKHGNPAQTLEFFGPITASNSTMAEVEAILITTSFIPILGIDTYNKIVVITTDCTSAIDIINKQRLLDKVIPGVQFKLKHVNGHRGTETPRNAVNTKCDRLAYNSMLEERKRLQGTI